MFDKPILPYRILSTRCSLIRYLLPALILVAPSASASAGHCLSTPPVTLNEEFFILGRVPELPADWTLDVVGEVAQPLSLSLDELRELPQSSIEATLECDYSSGPPLLVGNAVWTGVSLIELIELAVPKPEATTITFRALDGYRRGPFPLDEVLEKAGAMVAYEMNGEPLPEIQGWPARIALPGHVGHNWVRWLDSIEITSAPSGDSFRQWPIHARITRPIYNSIIGDCTQTIEGIVNAGEGREIVTVQISIDDGVTWENAEILTYFKPNVWKHWRYVWTPEKIGRHTIFARAVDEDGNVQHEDRPYGWRGYKQVVTVVPGTGCIDPQKADLNNDRYIDFSDFSHLAGQWLMTDDNLPADIAPGDGDGRVGIPDLVLLADHWLDCLVPVAADPVPAEGRVVAELAPVLAWSPPEGVTGYDVYLGTDGCAVADADHESQEYLGFVSEDLFALKRTLEPDKIYYWRVDQVGLKCTSHGKVWSFTTAADPSMSLP